jgi:glycosyltransferase EpsH
MNHDKRIQYFKKSKHTNAGDTRNIGINKASGLYCWFVDSDDFVSVRSIDILTGIIKKYSYPNLIIFPYKIITENGYKNSIEKKRQSTKNKITAINEENVGNYFQITTSEVWNKLFKLTLIKDNGVRFQSIKVTNDLFFTRALMSLTDSYLMLDNYLYFHDTTNKQCISATRGDFFFHIYCANIKLRAFLIEQNIYKKYKKTFLESFKINLKYERKCTNKIIYKAFHSTAIFFIGILVRC